MSEKGRESARTNHAAIDLGSLAVEVQCHDAVNVADDALRHLKASRLRFPGLPKFKTTYEPAKQHQAEEVK